MADEGEQRRQRRPARTWATGLATAALACALVVGTAVPASAASSGTGVDPSKLTWQRAVAGGAGNLNGIATDGKRFVVVGLVSGLPANVAPIWTSTDGLEWKRARVQGGKFPGQTILIAVVHQGSRFLAFGEPSSSAGSGTLAWSSKDGLVWQRYKPKGFPPTATSEPAEATTTKDGVALVVGDDSTNAYSLWVSHGDRWKLLGPVPQPGPPVASLSTIAPTGKGALSVAGVHSSNAVAWRSTTGRSWSTAPVQGTQPGTFSEINAVVPLRSGLVAALGTVNGPLGAEIPYVWTSRSGTSWAAESSNLTVFMGNGSNGQGMDAGVANGSGALAAGHDGGAVAFWSSRDGRHWKRVPDQPILTTGAAPSVSGSAIAHGRVVNIVRIRQFNGQSFDLVRLAIITGAPAARRSSGGKANG